MIMISTLRKVSCDTMEQLRREEGSLVVFWVSEINMYALYTLKIYVLVVFIHYQSHLSM